MLLVQKKTTDVEEDAAGAEEETEGENEEEAEPGPTVGRGFVMGNRGGRRGGALARFPPQGRRGGQETMRRRSGIVERSDYEEGA